MSTLKRQLQSDLTTAMRERDQVRAGSLRMALTAVTNEEVAGKEHRELTDDDVLKVLTKEAKKRREAADGLHRRRAPGARGQGGGGARRPRGLPAPAARRRRARDDRPRGRHGLRSQRYAADGSRDEGGQRCRRRTGGRRPGRRDRAPRPRRLSWSHRCLPAPRRCASGGSQDDEGPDAARRALRHWFDPSAAWLARLARLARLGDRRRRGRRGRRCRKRHSVSAA